MFLAERLPGAPGAAGPAGKGDVSAWLQDVCPPAAQMETLESRGERSSSD